MKFKLLTFFVIAGIAFAGCNSNNTTENLTDSTIVVDSVLRVDSVIVDTTPIPDTTIVNPM
ncbi:MAG: hypothetical protein WBJ10_13510 [Daejeonella sp.]|uniref:hypothetical protein n=1 Tax=Daejeonella sp. TaxID=2805397 RepID=UPI003C734ABF